MPEPVEGSRPYLAGLDGIRAVAVLGVIAYHLDLGWASGGLLGVGVFFVLSGYLITDLLVAEHRRHGRIDLRRFWIRRARRLLPALFLMLFVIVGWATLLDPIQLPALRSDLPSAVFYFSNWWFIFQHVSYFARFGPPSPLGHLWSLAIEEQFYLLWPLFVLAGLRWLRSRRQRITVVLVLALASAVDMGVLFNPLGDPTRVYDGTDTRAFALLAGAALALAWPRDLKVRPLTAGARRVLEGAGGAALVGILVLFGTTNEYESFLYPTGMLLCALFTAIVIVVTVHPGTRLGRALGVGPLRWIGARSYGIYLWSYPVIVLTTPLNRSPGPVRSVLDVAATLALSALSWRYVEDPIRHGALGRLWTRLRARSGSVGRPTRTTLVAGSLVFANVVVCAVGLSGLVASPSLDPATTVTAVLPVARHPRRPPPTTVPPATLVTGPTLPSPTRPTLAPGWATPTTTTTPPPSGAGVTAIGDSIMIDATPYLRQLLPGIEIDAQVGQQLYQIQSQVPKLRAEGAIGNRLILELGTNGAYSPAQLVDLLHSLGPMRRIVLVNVRVDRPWEQEVNQTIAAVAKTYPRVTVVDWHALGAVHPGYFYPDGIHLDPVGARYFASLLARAVDGPAPASTSPLPGAPAGSARTGTGTPTTQAGGGNHTRRA